REQASIIRTYLNAGGTVTQLSTQSAGYYGSGAGRGVLLTAPGKDPLLIVSGCPPSEADREYRVWVAKAGSRSAVRTLKVNGDGQGDLVLATPQPLDTYEQIGVTMVTPSGSHDDVLIGMPPHQI